MSQAAEFRAEAAQLRAISRGMNDPEELAAIWAMIDELEGRAKTMDNGSAEDNQCTK